MKRKKRNTEPQGVFRPYVLNGRTPVPLREDNNDDMDEWVIWCAHTDERSIARDWIGEVLVSTAFLCQDVRLPDEVEPVLFETTVFGGALDGESFIYATYDEAEEGHAAMLARVREETKVLR